MRITIDNTSKIVEISGVHARVWEGHTDSGIGVHCFVTRISCLAGERQDEFERELESCAAPTPEVRAIPLRMVL